MKFSKKEFTVIATLSILTALEALSIDLYLPAFDAIAKDLNISVGKVQISLSVFIGGFAVGQLLWGALSDRFGRKIPLCVGMLLFIVVSFFTSTVHTVEMLWFWRFIQAFSGSAGVVISRAVVTDIFMKERTITVFTILNILMGIVPIIAPIVGNLLLHLGRWQYVFIAMGIAGILALAMVCAFIRADGPKSGVQLEKDKRGQRTGSFFIFFRNKQFVVNMLIGSLAYSALMIYISNSPFLFIVKSGLSGTQYSLLFAINSLGLIGSSYMVNVLVKHFKLRSIVRFSAILQTVFAFWIILAAYMDLPIVGVFVLLFLYLMAIGIFLPAAMTLALAPHRESSGTASAVFGFVQLAVAFVISSIVGMAQDDSLYPMIFSLFFCALASMVLSQVNTKHSEHNS